MRGDGDEHQFPRLGLILRAKLAIAKKSELIEKKWAFDKKLRKVDDELRRRVKR